MSLTGNSYFLLSSLRQSLPPSMFSSSLSLPSHRKGSRRKKVPAMASFWNGGRPFDESGSFHRRVFLLVGVAFLPFLKLREVVAKEKGEEVNEILDASGFASIFLSQRNRNKDVKSSSSKLQDNSLLEETPNTILQDSKSTKLTESDIGASTPQLIGKEFGEQGGRKTELEIKVQGPRAAEQDTEVQDPNKIKESEIPSQHPKQTKQDAVQTTGGNPVVSFLNEIGIIGSCVVGALFAASQRERKALESTIDSMKDKMNDKERATALLKENFETRLLNGKEDNERQLRKFKEVEASLVIQLTSSKDAVAALGQELQSEKQLAGDLKSQKDQLEHFFKQNQEDKKILETVINEKVDSINILEDKISLLCSEMPEKEKKIQILASELSERESECMNLSTTMEQIRTELAAANSCIEQLKKDMAKVIKESNSKSSIINDLHEEIRSLTEEKDDSNTKFYGFMKEYNDLISATETTAAVNSELLSKKDEQIQDLKEKIKFASSEVRSKQAMISELTKERENANALLEKEKNNLYELKMKLQNAKELLVTTEAEASHTFKELIDSRTAYEEVMSTISKIQTDYDQERELLNTNLEEAKATSKTLSDQLESAVEVVLKTQEELVSSSNELKAVIEERESLKEELVDTYKKAETTANELKDERRLGANLRKELEVLQKHILKDSDARKTLEADLDEATRSLNEMNKSALLLSKELENSSSRNASHEAEKEMLERSLFEQKKIAQEMQENIEDAQRLITRLGGETKLLEKRSKRLEEELAAAKGEILRLRRQISVTKESVSEHHSKTNEASAGIPSSAKRNAGRRKRGAADTNVS